ncbi:AbrB/MazE/SpoVT family DNA-binding domain-containing protein [Falsiroseomonas sp.]|uniref:AbrB/MazE/SpoVT family DNA-binding domain-containing protein n=1 Tax=Falsiroseomonas sp. TaxID=2870721 RepID=UPI003F708634
MRAHRLQLDTRGRVLLTPALRAATGLVPGLKLRVAVEDGEVAVSPGEMPERGRSPTLDRKGRLTLPGPLRRSLGLVPGAVLLLRVDAPGLRLVTPARLLGRMKAARLALAKALEE